MLSANHNLRHHKTPALAGDQASLFEQRDLRFDIAAPHWSAALEGGADQIEAFERRFAIGTCSHQPRDQRNKHRQRAMGIRAYYYLST
jgi:hypothetical protein